MKTLYKFIGFLLLVLIGYQLLTIEGYPSDASYKVPQNGSIPDYILDKLRVDHRTFVFMHNETRGAKESKLKNLFDTGLSPFLFVYLGSNITLNSPIYNNVLATLRTAMQLSDKFDMKKDHPYVYTEVGYIPYYGPCSESDRRFKHNPEGTNCLLPTCPTCPQPVNSDRLVTYSQYIASPDPPLVTAPPLVTSEPAPSNYSQYAASSDPPPVTAPPPVTSEPAPSNSSQYGNPPPV